MAVSNTSFVKKEQYTYIVVAAVIVLSAMIGFAVKANKSADNKAVLDIAAKDITTDVEEYEEETIEKEELFIRSMIKER